MVKSHELIRHIIRGYLNSTSIAISLENTIFLYSYIFPPPECYNELFSVIGMHVSIDQSDLEHIIKVSRHFHVIRRYVRCTYLDDTMYQNYYKNTFKIHVLKYSINSHTHSFKVLKSFYENVDLQRTQSNFRNYETLHPYFLNKK